MKFWAGWLAGLVSSDQSTPGEDSGAFYLSSQPGLTRDVDIFQLKDIWIIKFELANIYPEIKRQNDLLIGPN